MIMARPDDATYKKLQWLLKRLSTAEDYCRPYFERAKRHYRLYRFGSAIDEKDWPYVNRTRTRDILAFVEDSTALMVQTLFSSEPFFNVDPRRTTQFEAMTGLNPMAISKQMEICLENQIADEATEFFEEIIDMFKGGCIYGNGYAGVYPRFSFDGKYIGPLIKATDFWDVLPISGARRISKARGVFIREFMSLEEAKDLAKKAGREDIIPQLGTMAGDDKAWHKSLLAEVGITDYEVDPDEIEMIHYFSGGHIITMANRAVIVRDSNEPVPNSLGDSQVVKPFPYDLPTVQYKFMPVPLEFFAMGIPEVLEVLQEDKNLIRSARRDNIDICIQKILKARAGADINYDLIKFYGGAIWPLENLNDLEALEIGDVTQSSYREEAQVASDMENALSFFGYARGMTPTHEERPTTVMRLQQASLNRLDLNVKLTEFTVLRNLATRILLLTRRFMSQGDYEAIIGDRDAGFYKLPEEVILRHFIAKPIGSSITKVKEIRQQQVQMAAMILEKLAPVAMSGPEPFQINWYQAGREGLESCDTKNVDQLLIKLNPQQAQQMAQQSQLQQLAQVRYGEDIKTQAEIKTIFAQAQADIAVNNAKPEVKRNVPG
jgi:hypothetical protein